MAQIPERPDGLILLDKPEGLTSHDCVARVRKLLPKKVKVGHGGTLDPFCTGLLILLVGRCTRLSSFFQGTEKTYEGVIRFGEGTDTLDRDGKVTEMGPIPELTEAGWRETARAFVGKSEQVPPLFSAKHVGKERAYELARRGEKPELKASTVEIFSFEVTNLDFRDLSFSMHCSSGTYVRAVARDIGERVGSPAHCHILRRTEVGIFRVENANSLQDPFAKKGFIPFDEIDLGFPAVGVDYQDEKRVLNGMTVIAPRDLRGEGLSVKLIGPSGRFIAVCRLEGRELKPETVFPL